MAEKIPRLSAGKKLYLAEVLSDNRRINGELLADAD